MFAASPSLFLHADEENTTYMLVLGTNPKVSNRGHNATDTLKLFKKNDRTLVVADPRETLPARGGAFRGLGRALAPRADEGGRRQLVAGLAERAQKDLSIALEAAGELGLALSGTSQCRENMARVYGADGGAGSS